MPDLFYCNWLDALVSLPNILVDKIKAKVVIYQKHFFTLQNYILSVLLSQDKQLLS